ncbi:MAG: rod shape-determining protein RodA [Bacteroidales bacterium]|nr:rod shape-determining protein RodA [Bacteroidales bacterium]
MNKNQNIWAHIDKVTVVIFVLMVGLGWLNIYAAVFNEERSGIFDMSQRYGKQFVWIIATFILAILVLSVDSRFYSFFAWIIYGAVMLLLAGVLVLGNEINGAKSWYALGEFSLQPSEFAKFATALALAAYLSGSRHDLTKPLPLFTASAIIILPVIFIVLQPDMGSALVFFSLYLVLFREGMSAYIFVSGLLAVALFVLTLLWNNLIVVLALVLIAAIIIWYISRKLSVASFALGIVTAIGGILYLADRFLIKSLGPELVAMMAVLLSGLPFIYYVFMRRANNLVVVFLFLVGSVLYVNTVDYGFNHLLKEHQRERINITLGFESDPHGKGYNVNQSIISIGSGGFSGKGYLQGTQTKFKFVPEQSTDFIFCTVGEEWGFLGSLTVTGLYVFLLLRLLKMAERQKAVFSRIYGYGVFSILFVHFFINIGMAIGLVPVIGIPLPFFSYGGSSLWGFTVLLFIFLRLDASRTEYLI